MEASGSFFTSMKLYPIFWRILTFFFTHWTYGVGCGGKSLVGYVKLSNSPFFSIFFFTSLLSPIFSSMELLYGEANNTSLCFSFFFFFLHSTMFINAHSIHRSLFDFLIKPQKSRFRNSVRKEKRSRWFRTLQSNHLTSNLTSHSQ